MTIGCVTIGETAPRQGICSFLAVVIANVWTSPKNGINPAAFALLAAVIVITALLTWVDHLHGPRSGAMSLGDT